MFTVGGAEFTVGGAVFTVGGAKFTVGGVYSMFGYRCLGINTVITFNLIISNRL